MPSVNVEPEATTAIEEEVQPEATTPASAPKKKRGKKQSIVEAEQQLEESRPVIKAHGRNYRELMTEVLGGKLHLLCGGWDEENDIPNMIEMPDIDFRITGRMARGLLGWETEPDFKARMLADNPNLDPAECTFHDCLEQPPSFLFGHMGKNPTKEAKKVGQVKVVCWNNDRNRPIDMKRCEEFAQTILQREWAGFHTMESINGEAGVIGMTGQALSIQHCLVGLLIAIDRWEKQFQHWEAFWPEEPFIEKLVVIGVSEVARVCTTLDNVRPRSSADELYVGDDFRDLLPSQRKEVARMGERAIQLLWQRTGAAETDQWADKLTHAVVKDFIRRHPKIKECLRFIFDLNKTHRSLTLLGTKSSILSPGQCAAMMYLMGCSTSDMRSYRDPSMSGLPHEGTLDWERWDMAERFWATLAMVERGSPSDGESNHERHARLEANARWLELEPVRQALRALGDPEGNTSGNLLEKTCILAMAWQEICNGRQHEPDALKLEFFDKGMGERVLVNRDTFGGIDACHVAAPDLTRNLTEEEKEAKKQQQQLARQQKEKEEHDKKVAAAAKRQEEETAKKMAEANLKPPSGKPGIDTVAAQAVANAGKGANGKPLTSKQVQAAQTAKAAEDDKAAANGPAAKPKQQLPKKQPLRGGTGK